MAKVDLNDAFLHCRTLGHDWETIPDDGGLKRSYKESRAVGRITRRCPVCTSVKLIIWSKITGEIIGRDMRYPDGYQYAIDDRPERNALRKELLRRRDSQPNGKSNITSIAKKRSA